MAGMGSFSWPGVGRDSERGGGCRAGFQQVSMDTNMRPGGFHVIHRNLVTREMGADIIVVQAAGSL